MSLETQRLYMKMDASATRCRQIPREEGKKGREERQRVGEKERQKETEREIGDIEQRVSCLSHMCQGMMTQQDGSGTCQPDARAAQDRAAEAEAELVAAEAALAAGEPGAQERLKRAEEDMEEVVLV